MGDPHCCALPLSQAYTPVITILVLVALGMRRPSLPVAGCITAMAIFASVAAYGELQFSLFGFTLMMMSSVAESVRVVSARTPHPVAPRRALFILSPAATGRTHGLPVCLLVCLACLLA